MTPPGFKPWVSCRECRWPRHPGSLSTPLSRYPFRCVTLTGLSFLYCFRFFLSFFLFFLLLFTSLQQLDETKRIRAGTPCHPQSKAAFLTITTTPYLHTEDDKAHEDEEVVPLEVVNVFNDAFWHRGHTVGQLEALGVDEVPPWFDSLSGLGEPLPCWGVGQGDRHQSAGRYSTIIITLNRTEKM